MSVPHRIVSGGQTGVDRAALDVALALGIECGGWCPKGRRAEDGPIDPHYPLIETPSRSYLDRTRRNVRDSDATLVLAWGEPSGGTKRTVAIARTLHRPVLVLDLETDDHPAALRRAREWLASEEPAILNVAGPRESTRSGAYDAAFRFLEELFSG